MTIPAIILKTLYWLSPLSGLPNKHVWHGLRRIRVYQEALPIARLWLQLQNNLPAWTEAPETPSKDARDRIKRTTACHRSKSISKHGKNCGPSGSLHYWRSPWPLPCLFGAGRNGTTTRHCNSPSPIWSSDTDQLDRIVRPDRGSEQSRRLQALEDKLSEQRELIATQQRQIDHNARELLEAGNRTRTDWLLAEAEYLLRVANQRLMIEKDIRGALAALESGDEVLAESDDIGVYPVRQQLAKEILALKGIVDVDRTGLYLKLEAAIDSIHQLTDSALIHDRAPGFVSSGENPEADASGQPGLVAEGWNKFKPNPDCRWLWSAGWTSRSNPCCLRTRAPMPGSTCS